MRATKSDKISRWCEAILDEEGGAGEIVRRKLLHECDVHTLLRLPTGIFYAQGVKANVIFFDRRPANPKAQTSKVWVYDLRTNQHFTLKTSPLKRADLNEFVAFTTQPTGGIGGGTHQRTQRGGGVRTT